MFDSPLLYQNSSQVIVVSCVTVAELIGTAPRNPSKHFTFHQSECNDNCSKQYTKRKGRKEEGKCYKNSNQTYLYLSPYQLSFKTHILKVTMSAKGYPRKFIKYCNI